MSVSSAAWRSAAFETHQPRAPAHRIHLRHTLVKPQRNRVECLLPHAAAHVNKGGTPDVALFATSAAVLLLVATGSFASVLALAAFFFVMQYGVSFTSLFILRKREPDLPRPYRAIGYPVIPAIVLLGAIAFVVGSFFGDRANTLKSVAVLLASYPVYRLVIWLRRAV